MFRIDYKSGLPIYEQIYRGVVKLASIGGFGESGQLPSVRSVAQDLGINPNTVQKAYGLLERDGIICSLPGKGSFLSAGVDPAKRRQEDARIQLTAALREALDSGLGRKDICGILDTIWEEGSYHD